MAKGYLENKWKDKKLSYYKRRKEAEGYLDYALGIVDRAQKRNDR
jgi:hypothetical protein